MSVRGRLYKNSLSQGSLVHQIQLLGWLLVRSWADACEQGCKQRARAGGGPEKFGCGSQIQSVLQPWQEDDHVVQVRVDCEERVQEVDRGSGVLQVQRDKLEAVALRGVVPRGGQVVERLQVVLPVQIQLLVFKFRDQIRQNQCSAYLLRSLASSTS